MTEAFDAEPGRLDAVVSAHLGVPRAEVQRAIVAGGVLVDGAARAKSHRLAGGERIQVDLAPAAELPAEGPPLELAWRDEHLVVVAQAGGPADPPHREPARRDPRQPAARDGGAARARAAGRCVRGSCTGSTRGRAGLLVVAKDDATFEALLDDVQAATRWGARTWPWCAAPSPTTGSRSTRRSAGPGAKIRVDATGGREASTAFEVRERFERATLLEAEPRTGRTHQIRVHLSSVGHPILGDRSYGGGGDDARGSGWTRPFLHAWRIGFEHPVTGERIDLEDPLPADLERALERGEERPGGLISGARRSASRR